MPETTEIVPADDIDVLDDEVIVDDETTKDDGEDKDDLEDEDEKDEGKDDKEDVEEDELGPRRPSFKEIKEKYPTLFKDFPDLREAFFRESEYTKVFSTVDEARDAADELSTLSTMRDRVLEGDFSVVLESAKEADPNSYSKLVSNLLPALYKIDQNAFMQAITPSIENMLRSAHRDGLSSSNEDLVNSALHISKWFFDTEEVATGKTTTVKKSENTSEKETNLQRQITEFEATKFRDAHNHVVTDIDVILSELILDGFDPDDELTQYVKDKLTKDIQSEIGSMLQKDSSHMARMNALWKRAKQEGYSRDSLKRVVSAYQTRAKSLVPSVRAKLKKTALGKAVGKKDAARANDVMARKELPPGTPSNRGNRLPTTREVDWSTSDMDILDGKVKTRK